MKSETDTTADVRLKVLMKIRICMCSVGIYRPLCSLRFGKVSALLRLDDSV